MRRHHLPLALIALCSRPVIGLEFFSDRTVATKGPEILNRNIGAGPASRGGTGAAWGDDANSLFWNPAWIQDQKRSEALFTHENGFSGERLDSVAWVRPTWARGRRRTWGLSAAYLSQDSFEIKSNDQSMGQANPYDLAAGVTYAQPWGKSHAGLTAKYVRQELFSTSAQAIAADIGWAFSGTRFRTGAALVNLGTPLQGSGESVGLPLSVKGGGAYDLYSRPRQHVWIVGQLDAPADDRPVVHGGLEYTALFSDRWTLSLRGGYQTVGVGEGISSGFGLQRENWGFNYGFQMQKELGDLHRLDLSFRFGDPLRQEQQRSDLIQATEINISQNDLLSARKKLNELNALSPGDPAVIRLRQKLESRLAETVDPATLFAQGVQLVEAGETEKAMALFEKVLVIEPRYPHAQSWLDRCRSTLEEQRVRQMKKELARAKEKEWTRLMGRARDWENSKNWGEAAKTWKKAREAGAPPSASNSGLERCRRAFVDLADRREKETDWDGALAALRSAQTCGDPDKELSARMVRLEKTKTDAQKRLAQSTYTEGMNAYEAGDVPRARGLFQKAVSLDPANNTYQRALDRTRADRTNP